MTRILAVPPQHGAWAFLAIPLIIGFVTIGVSPTALAFAIAWIAAYPASYYGTQGIAARIRRGRWSVRARAELRRALPWAVIAAFGGAGSQPASLDGLIARMEREEFDLIAVGRALLSDPNWVLKVRDGRQDELKAFSRSDMAVLH